MPAPRTGANILNTITILDRVNLTRQLSVRKVGALGLSIIGGCGPRVPRNGALSPHTSPAHRTQRGRAGKRHQGARAGAQFGGFLTRGTDRRPLGTEVHRASLDLPRVLGRSPITPTLCCPGEACGGRMLAFAIALASAITDGLAPGAAAALRPLDGCSARTSRRPAAPAGRSCACEFRGMD